MIPSPTSYLCPLSSLWLRCLLQVRTCDEVT